MKSVSVLGATGSIGQHTVDLLAREPDVFDVIALTGGRNIARLAEDAKRLRARIAVTAHDDCLEDLRSALAGTGIETPSQQSSRSNEQIRMPRGRWKAENAYSRRDGLPRATANLGT